MQKKDCFLFGTVFKLHGYKGSVNIYNNNNTPVDLTTLEYFLIEYDNDLVPHFIETARPSKRNVILVKFKDVDSEEKAKIIQKRRVYLPKDCMPETDENNVSIEKLIGYSVIDTQLGNLGEITYINTKTAQKLIYVEKNEKEFCFPMHDEFVKEVNPKERVMRIKIPKEFLTLN